jgi:uncharacterized ferredoxin-like protein
VIKGIKAEEKAILAIAEIMASSARTAPKGRGIDNIVTAIIYGDEKDYLADVMEKKVKNDQNIMAAFKRDAGSIRKSPVLILIGVKGTKPKNLDCGACGYDNCVEFSKSEKKKGEDFTGPVCIFEAMDLGIALGSAAKMANGMNIDNRLMYTVGSCAKELELIKADVIIGIPLSTSGKNIYFDRK